MPPLTGLSLAGEDQERNVLEIHSIASHTMEQLLHASKCDLQRACSIPPPTGLASFFKATCRCCCSHRFSSSIPGSTLRILASCLRGICCNCELVR